MHMPRPKVDIPDGALEWLIEGASLRQAAPCVPCAAETLRKYAASGEGRGRMSAIRARRRRTQRQRERRAERRAEAEAALARQQAANAAQRKRPLGRDQRGRFTPVGWDERSPVRILPPPADPLYDILPLGKSVERDEVAAYLADGWTCPTPEQFEKLRREFAARR